ncbi:glycine zipper family protein [Aliidongia dinghuensis]|nr:glycine zipper family protein [Aliidongia dinghuensis]
MSRLSVSAALLGSLALGACVAAPPSGPSVAVMPGPGKTLAQFQQDDLTCRNYAEQQTGGVQPAQAANDSAVSSAVVGTGLGAAAGALIGAAAGNAGIGAAAGAGAGLLMGSAAGANNAQLSGAALQRRYDVGYMQCMAANGESVPPVQQAARPAYYPAPAYAYPAPVYYPYPPPPPYYYGPSVAVGFGFGGGRHW